MRLVLDHVASRAQGARQALMNSAHSRLTLALCALATMTAPEARAADAPLGRLFFTSSQRASLDVARTQRARTTLATEKTDEVTAAPVPQTLSYDGAVRRSDGKSTVFVNGRAVNEKDTAAGTIVGLVRP